MPLEEELSLRVRRGREPNSGEAAVLMAVTVVSLRSSARIHRLSITAVFKCSDDD